MAAESFAADWLALREPVDHRSRADSLTEPLAAWGRARGALRVADLGSGTGSNLRYLARRLSDRQEWTLVDHDAALLARALALGVELEPGVARVERVQGDLAREGLDAVGRADLATASALLDLVSEAWVGRLVRACAAAGCAGLFALSWDGVMEWGGAPDAHDALALAAFAEHQRRDKGVGPALGPTAALVAARLFQLAGYRTVLASSPWRLGPAERALAGQLLDGWERAAVEQLPGEAGRLRAWAGRRRATLAGGFRLTVGHLDLLALPPER